MNNKGEFIPRFDIQPLPPRRLWDEFASIAPESVLYGGTATALHLGHHDSVNFEFFGDIGKALTIPACRPPSLGEDSGAGLACQHKTVLTLRNGEMDLATIDELENRTRFLESEVEGEKTVTRHVLRQASLNADDLGALKTGVRHLEEQMVLANAALNTQGGRITLLAQDVTMIRQDVTALRRDMEAVNARLDRQDSRLDAMDSRLDGMESRLDRMESRLERMESRLDSMDNRLSAIERNVAAILAAVAPGSPPPA